MPKCSSLLYFQIIVISSTAHPYPNTKTTHASWNGKSRPNLFSVIEFICIYTFLKDASVCHIEWTGSPVSDSGNIPADRFAIFS